MFGRIGALAPFRQRSFRFNWPADLATSWAFEMETLILGWYILAETGSAVWLSVYAALQFTGTLLSPLFGVAGDRLGHARVLCAMRAFYAVLAGCVTLATVLGALSPALVLVAAALLGLVRPSDISVRTTLVGIIMPPPQIMAAVGINRTTADSARVMGALAGAALVGTIGMTRAYLLISSLYCIAFVLTWLGDAGTDRPVRHAAPPSPWRETRDGFGYVLEQPALTAAMLIAFLVNLCAFPLSGGLLPFVAREVYHIDRIGLGYLAASFAGGALVGSVLCSAVGHLLSPGRSMVWGGLAWYALLLVYAQSSQAWQGMALLALAGFAQSLSLVPMAALLLQRTAASFRGRVMGVRSLAVYGLPLALLAAGPLLEGPGFRLTATLYAGCGLVCMALIGWRYRRVLTEPRR